MLQLELVLSNITIYFTKLVCSITTEGREICSKNVGGRPEFDTFAQSLHPGMKEIVKCLKIRRPQKEKCRNTVLCCFCDHSVFLTECVHSKNYENLSDPLWIHKVFIK